MKIVLKLKTLVQLLNLVKFITLEQNWTNLLIMSLLDFYIC